MTKQEVLLENESLRAAIEEALDCLPDDPEAAMEALNEALDDPDDEDEDESEDEEGD